MALLRWLFGLLLATAFHLLGLRLLPGLQAFFDPFLILVVYHSLDREPAFGILGGAATGLAHDALSGGLFGLHGFADTLVAFLSARLQQRFVMQQPLQICLLFALAGAMQQALLSLLQYFFVARPEMPDPLSAVLSMGVTAALGYAVYAMSRRLRAWFRKNQQTRQRKLTIDAK